jgi:hypothetical protein
MSGVIVACGFVTLVGVFFGFYASWRASPLLPADCLRDGLKTHRKRILCNNDEPRAM